MDKRYVVDNIIKLSRKEKEYLFDNFENISNIVISDIDGKEFVKTAAEDYRLQIYKIIGDQIASDPEAIRLISQFMSGDTSVSNLIFDKISEAFAKGLLGISEPEQMRYEFLFEQLLKQDLYTVIKNIPLPASVHAVPPGEMSTGEETPAEEPSAVLTGDPTVKFSEFFGVQQEKVQIIEKGRYGLRYAVYNGVVNVPIDKSGNILLNRNDADFIKNTIDGFESFFATEKQEVVSPESVSEYNPSNLNAYNLRISTDPLAKRYRDFFQMKTKHFDELSRMDVIQRNFQNRMLDIHESLTGQSFISYQEFVGKVDSNTRKKYSAFLVRRVFGTGTKAQQEKDTEMFPQHAARTPEDDDLFREIVSLRSADDLANDYIGIMQKLYIGNTIGQDTHDAVMHLGSLIYGNKVSGRSEKDIPNFVVSLSDISIGEIVSGGETSFQKIDVNRLSIPMDVLGEYGFEGSSYEEITPDIKKRYLQDVTQSAESVRSLFKTHGIADDEQIKIYLDRYYKPEKFVYYKNAAEVTKYYQMQTEMSRVSEMSGRSTTTWWCTKCGRFRPDFREGENAYLEVPFRESDGSISYHKTYNIGPERYQMVANIYKKLGLEPPPQISKGLPDGPITEYEKKLGEEVGGFSLHRCENFSPYGCTMDNFIKNVIKPASKESTDPRAYWGFVPLQIFGQEMKMLDKEEYGLKQIKPEKNRTIMFPSGYKEAIESFATELKRTNPEIGEAIEADIIDVIRFMSTVREMANLESVMDSDESPVNHYLDTCQRMIGYIANNMTEDRKAKLTTLSQTSQSNQNGKWATLENLTKLDALRKFISLFSFDSFSKSFLDRIWTLDTISFEQQMGLDLEGTHPLYGRDNITGNISVPDVALLSCPSYIDARTSVDNFVRKMMMSRLGQHPELFGLFYPEGESDENKADKAMIDRALSDMLSKPIRIPKFTVLFDDMIRWKKPTETSMEETRKMYVEFLDNFNPRKYTPEQMARIDLYCYDVDPDTMMTVFSTIIDEARKINRGFSFLQLSQFNSPLEGGIKWNTPALMRRDYMSKYINEPFPAEDVSRGSKRNVMPNLFANIAWFRKNLASVIAENPDENAVLSAYQALGITGRQMTDPIIDMTLLKCVKDMPGMRVRFKNEPQNPAVKTEIEIEMLLRSLREECLFIYNHVQEYDAPVETRGRTFDLIGTEERLQELEGLERPEPEGLTRKQKGEYKEYQDITQGISYIAAALNGDDMADYNFSKSDKYNSAIKYPTYKLAQSFIFGDPSQNRLFGGALSESGAEDILKEARYRTSFEGMTPEQQLQHRPIQREYQKTSLSPSSTDILDSMIKYLISTDEMADWIVKDMSESGAYLEPYTRQAISTLLLSNMQGPNARKKALTFFPNMAAYHIQNTKGYLEPRQSAYNPFMRSTENSPALITLLLQDAMFGGFYLDQIVEETGGRTGYSRRLTGKEQQQSSKGRKRREEEMKRGLGEFGKNSSVDKTWYKKSQMETQTQQPTGTLDYKQVLMYTDRDSFLTLRNIINEKGFGGVSSPVLPKIFMAPFDDFGSLSALASFSKETGFNCVPISEKTASALMELGLI